MIALAQAPAALAASRRSYQNRKIAIVRIAQCFAQESVTCSTYAAQIDLRFGNAPCEFLDFGISVFSCDLAR